MIEIEHRPPDSPYIERVWSSRGASAATRMHSIAYAEPGAGGLWEDRSAIVNDRVAQPAGAVVARLYVVGAADINVATAWAEKPTPPATAASTCAP
ncbi:hypothetical protein [Saccharopolyspora spinosa]|uniref:Uncharacterized protein n=1 Tax=Saccharopolyspora spinosa TaxID=60894 RepID=A0A2N3XST2_SACSN|nr:hypothetical protein [Saccharopolyspora spinosa]PKW13692.1 hypothetical protein A8926_1240 [Saccharopolyspora spinosa]